MYSRPAASIQARLRSFPALFILLPCLVPSAVQQRWHLGVLSLQLGERGTLQTQSAASLNSISAQAFLGAKQRSDKLCVVHVGTSFSARVCCLHCLSVFRGTCAVTGWSQVQAIKCQLNAAIHIRLPTDLPSIPEPMFARTFWV